MGVHISFDKHVSSLDELLSMSAPYFAKVKFESKIDPTIEKHLKVSTQLKCRSGALTMTSRSLRTSESRLSPLRTYSKTTSNFKRNSLTSYL